VFLLVSPLDKVVAFPFALIGGALLAAPRPGVWARTVPPAPGAWGRLAWGATLAVAGLLIVVTSVAGAQYWRADKAFADAARIDTPSAYARAADLFTWEPFYTLEAGGKMWREGLAGEDAAAVDQGRALIARGIDRDPTGPMGYADLARLAIAQGDPEEAVEQVRRGLRWNPDHPVLQALWGYAALTTVSQLKDQDLGVRLAADLEELPASTPDAWYWLSEVRRATGDAAGATQARARAKQLGPKLTAHRFEQRLLAR
jgi:tetratricopeptide (TPR) repeat protein